MILPAPIGLGVVLIAGCAVHPRLAAGDAAPPTAAATASPPAATALRTPAERAQFHVMAGELAAGRGLPKPAAEQFLQALALAPDAKLAARATELALAAKDSELAQRAAHTWLAAQPDSLEAREVLIRLALVRADTQQAFEQSRAIIDRHPGGIDDGFHLVALLLAQNLSDADTALALIGRLAAAYSHASSAWRAQALVALHFKRYRDAESAAQHALQLEPDSVDAGMMLTAARVQLGDLAGADAAVRTLAQGARAHDVQLAYARLLLSADHSEHARGVLQRVLSRSPRDEDARFMLALLELSENHLDAAQRQFSQLHQSDAHGQEAEYYLGRIAELQRQPQMALQHYRRVTAGAKALDASLRRALVLGQLGRVDQARTIFDQLDEQYPPLAAHFAAAEAQMLLGAKRPTDAAQVLEQALQQSPDDPELLYGRALAYEKLGRVADAESDLHRIVGHDPNDAQALNALGYMMTIHGGDYAQAREFIEKANLLSPNDPAIMDSLGWVIYRQGDADTAVGWLRKAYALQPEAEIATHLGKALGALGDVAGAQRVLKQALARDPGNAQLREALDQLRK
ncbi:MAG: tetratricopeptide repeat protein [Gammaproteobacteria bacterium]|nr:tetratricopeptide repeat protein [Gammaproteobacteria bacterium]